jgi:hypothetical protein
MGAGQRASVKKTESNMPSPQAHYDAFIKDVRGLTWHFRLKKSSIKGLADRLQNQITNNQVAHFDPVAGDVNMATRAARNACANPADPRLRKYEPAIRRLAGVWGSTLKDYPIVPKTAQIGVTPFGATKHVKNKLNEMKNFASMDAFANCPRQAGQPPVDWNAGFAGCVAPSKRAEVMQRHDAAAQRGATTGVGGGGIGGFGIKNINWREEELRKAHQKVWDQQAGICILFAKAAAYILGSGLTHGPRIEIVSYANHAFVILGRTGGYINGNNFDLPKSNDDENGWGDDWVIIDGWAGAMGYDVTYQKDAGYPYKSMLNPVTLVMVKDRW